jgi:predicted transport protein
MPLYQLKQNSVQQIKPSSFKNERELQKLFEENLESLLGARFIASEFTTGDRQRGRIDTLGLDEDGTPVIIEYKKSSKENVINQGLFYLDWLVDHKGDFTIAAQETLGKDIEIDWSSPRLILVAESFSEYDKYAVNRIGANIQLWTYRKYGDGFLFLDAIFSNTTQITPKKNKSVTANTAEEETNEEITVYTTDDHLQDKPVELKKLFDAFREKVFALNADGDILEKASKIYVSYKHGKNFCEVAFLANSMKIWLDIPFSDIDDPNKLCRDVSKVGHHGTGQTETKLSNISEIENIMYLVEQSYRQTL